MATFQLGMLGLLAVHQAGAQGAQRNLDLTLATGLAKSALELRHVADNTAAPAPAYFDRNGISTDAANAYFTVIWSDQAPLTATYFDIVVDVTWLLPTEKVTADWPGHKVQMRTRIVR